MSRSFNGWTDRLDWNNIFNTVSSLTISAWIYEDTATGTDYVFCSHNSSDTGFAEIFGIGYIDASNTSVFFNAAGSTALQRSISVATTGIVGGWHHVVITWDGSTTATNVHIYFDGVEPGSYLVTVNGNSLTAGTGKLSLGGRIYDDNRPFAGNIAEFGAWNAVLNSTQIAALAAGATPNIYSTNLQFYYSARTDTTTAETGGAATTVDGTSYSSAHPALDFFSSLAGAITPAGTIINAARKILAGELTSAGSLIAQKMATVYYQAVAGALTSAGTLVKSGRKVLAGALAPAGTVIKAGRKVLAGAITPAGPAAWIRDVFTSLAGTVTPAGTVVKAGRKPLAGELTSAGALVKAAWKVLAGALTSEGLLSAFKNAGATVYYSVLVGALTPAGEVVRSGRKVLSGALAPAGDVLKRALKLMEGYITPAGTVSKQIRKILAGVLDSAGDLATSFIGGAGTLYTQTVAGALTMAGVIATRTNKILTGVLTPAGSITKRITKAFVGALSFTGDLIERLVSTIISIPGSVVGSDALIQLVVGGDALRGDVAGTDRSDAVIWYASPTGSSTAAGTIGDPRDLASLIGAGSPATPGDMIYLRAGTYTPLVAGTVSGATATNGTAVAGKGVYTLAINGTSGSPIIIQNYPGEAVRINGAVHAVSGTASYITMRGLEIAATPTARSFASRTAVDFPGIYITAAGIWIDRCYIHDLMQAYVYAASGFKFTQNIIGLCGVYLADEGYTGYSIYTHNNPGGAMTIHKNVFLGAYNGYNLGFQSAGANAVKDYDVQQNVIFAGGALWGSASGVDSGNVFSYNWLYNPTRTASYLYTSMMRSRGYDNSNPENWTVQHNLMWFKGGDTPFFLRALTVNFSYNTVIGTGGVFAKLTPTIYTEAITMDHNTYYATLTPAGFTHPSSGVGLTLAQWQAASGWDLNSTYTVALPAANTTGVLTDDNYRGRGILYAFNYLGSSSISFDLTTLNITDGALCRYYNALNKSEYVDFTYSAASPTLTISMLAASWSVVTPTAHDAPRAWAQEPFPNFGVFLVEELES